jgi:macrodomain Ter protein organizer (MatP/YcbG family)
MEANDKPKLKEPKLDFSEWKRKNVKSTRQLMMCGTLFTHYLNENGDCVATGLGEGPYHMQLWIYHHIEAQLDFKAKKAIEEEAERADREAAKLTKQKGA